MSATDKDADKPKERTREKPKGKGKGKGKSKGKRRRATSVSEEQDPDSSVPARATKRKKTVAPATTAAVVAPPPPVATIPSHVTAAADPSLIALEPFVSYHILLSETDRRPGSGASPRDPAPLADILEDSGLIMGYEKGGASATLLLDSDAIRKLGRHPTSLGRCASRFLSRPDTSRNSTIEFNLESIPRERMAVDYKVYRANGTDFLGPIQSRLVPADMSQQHSVLQESTRDRYKSAFRLSCGRLPDSMETAAAAAAATHLSARSRSTSTSSN